MNMLQQGSFPGYAGAGSRGVNPIPKVRLRRQAAWPGKWGAPGFVRFPLFRWEDGSSMPQM